MLCSPTRENGTVARIFWALSRVVEHDPLSSPQAQQLRLRAELACDHLIRQGESANAEITEDDGGERNKGREKGKAIAMQTTTCNHYEAQILTTKVKGSRYSQY